jgi:hypothetical protein
VDTFYYLVSDGQGGITVDSATVTILDVTPPTICSCATNMVVLANPNCLAPLPDLRFSSGLLATDTCSSVTITQSPLPGVLVGPGVTTVTLFAFDAAGNVSTCSPE